MSAETFKINIDHYKAVKISEELKVFAQIVPISGTKNCHMVDLPAMAARLREIADEIDPPKPPDPLPVPIQCELVSDLYALGRKYAGLMPVSDSSKAGG